MSGVVGGIHHVQVAAPAGCEAAARRFYGELLGLREIEKPPALAARGGCWFVAGAQELHVGVSERFSAAEKAHPAFDVVSLQALDALAGRLAAEGVDIVWPSPDELPGRRRFFADDPWGNRLEFLA